MNKLQDNSELKEMPIADELVSKNDNNSKSDKSLSVDFNAETESEVTEAQTNFNSEDVAALEENGSDHVDFDKANWYIVQCFSGHEHKVLHHIQELIEDPQFNKYLYRVLVPSEEVVEIKNNKRVERTVRLYPGYVFIQMDPQDYLCFEIRKLPGVTKFIGGTKSEPSPVSDVDILKVLRKVGDKTKTIDVDFENNEEIKVIDGPFRGYVGLISEVNLDRGALKVMISIFGRETPVELNFDQVEKTV
tara:strand:- start:88 stop:828 length:741 start_codon:yes stop_codon:yes gene_type:complete